MNYSVKGTPLSGDGSDLKPDAAVGVQFYNSSFHTGFSVNQVFNSELQPLEEITVLSPFLNITADKKWNISDQVLFVPGFAIQVPLTNQGSNKSKVLVDMNLNFTLYKRLFLSTGLHNNDMINISAGINDIFSADGKLNIHLTYTSSLVRKAEINTDFLELGIFYFF